LEKAGAKGTMQTRELTQIWDESQGKKILLNITMKNDLDRFFSYFSECQFKPFKHNKASNNELNLFGIHYSMRYDHGRIQCIKNTNNGSFYEKQIDLVIKRFFNITIKHSQRIDENNYSNFKDGYYIIPNGCFDGKPNSFDSGGEPVSESSTIKLIDIGNDYFIAYLEIRCFSTGDEDQNRNFEKNIKVIIQKIRGNGENRYT
jgi:hypothetical protein